MTFYCLIGQKMLNFVTNCCKLLKVNQAAKREVSSTGDGGWWLIVAGCASDTGLIPSEAEILVLICTLEAILRKLSIYVTPRLPYNELSTLIVPM